MLDSDVFACGVALSEYMDKAPLLGLRLRLKKLKLPVPFAMPTFEDIFRYLEKKTGVSRHGDEGIHFGDPDRALKHVLLCWLATPEALQEAGRLGCDAVIGHETLWYPYDAAVNNNNPVGWSRWDVNTRRRELLEKHDLSFARIHMLLDYYNISEEFARLLGFTGNCDLMGYMRLYRTAPTPVIRLLEQTRMAFGVEHMRVAAPRGKTHQVSNILCAGGAFMNCERLIEELHKLSVDMVITGEVHDLSLRMCHEYGITLIETSHEVSENPGLKKFATDLEKIFPKLKVSFYENPRIWFSM